MEAFGSQPLKKSDSKKDTSTQNLPEDLEHKVL